MNIPNHVAIIMDGNGRWATGLGLPRIKGHKIGAQSAYEIIETASSIGIKHLTLYAFSTENWQRPHIEVITLMALLRVYLRIFLPKLKNKNIKFHHLGDKNGLPFGIQKDLLNLEAITVNNCGMIFHLAINYGSRAEIVQAAKKCIEDGLKPDDINEQDIADRLWTKNMPDVDLLIRTSGESRLSNFMLWQAAYAELYLTNCLWPDFRRDQFCEAISVYSRRERRFGCIR